MSEANVTKDEGLYHRIIYYLPLAVSMILLFVLGVFEYYRTVEPERLRHKDDRIQGVVKVYESDDYGVYADIQNKTPVLTYECVEDFYSSPRVDWSTPLTIVINVDIDKDFPVNTQYLLFMDGLSMRIYLNGRLSFDSIGGIYKNAIQNKRKTHWVAFTSPGIRPVDDIQFVFTTRQRTFNQRAFKTTIHSFQRSVEPFVYNSETILSLLFLLLSICAIVLGLMAVVMYAVFIKTGIHLSQLFYFSFYVICSGLWYVVDNNINNFLIPMSAFYRTLEMVNLMLLSGFFSMYVQSFLQERRKDLVRILAAALIIITPVLIVLQTVSAFDFFSCYAVLQSVSLFVMAISGACIIYEGKFEHYKPAERIMIPSTVIVISFILDILVEGIPSVPVCIFSKLGSLYFVISQCRELLDYLVLLIQRTAEAKYYREIAYKDTLTHVSNRTSWNERLKRIEEDKENLTNYGLVLFDLNGLKLVNDLMGHQNGDVFISSACKIICDVFDSCEVYRIGGDEFVALLKGFTPSECDKKILEFDTACGKWNWENTDALFEMSVSSGGAIFDPEVDTTFEETVARADAFMYQDKLETKGKAR